MRRWSRGKAGAAAALGLGAAAAAFLALSHPKQPGAGAYARDRLPRINAELAAISSPFILAAGDSHAELLSPTPLCGLPTVNGGVSGAGTRVYAGVARGLVLARRPRAALLMIGTNDLFSKNHPSEPAHMGHLVADARAIIDVLAAATDRLVVTAVPPVSPRVAPIFDAEALATLSGELRRLCEAKPGCNFTDPFAGLREEGHFAVARPGALADDLHLADYPAMGRALEAALCPTGGAVAGSTRP